MVNQFTFWLEGIVEDNPLPEEIKIIVFNIKVNGNYKYVELLGYEKEINLNANIYYPLEAQFFNNYLLAKQQLNVFYNKVKYLIDESFSSNFLKVNFEKRKIYIRYNDKIEFLFHV